MKNTLVESSRKSENAKNPKQTSDLEDKWKLPDQNSKKGDFAG